MGEGNLHFVRAMRFWGAMLLGLFGGLNAWLMRFLRDISADGVSGQAWLMMVDTVFMGSLSRTLMF